MAARYSSLFEPINIGRLSLKNRIAMAPMGINGMTNPDGSPNQRCIDYYLERARGGVGLIITGLFKVENAVEDMSNYMPRITFPAVGPLSELCEASHALGTKIFIQLTAGWGRVSPGARFGMQPVSASVLPAFWDPSVTCRALTTEEVEKIVKAFGMAAELVARAGVDGVELHGHEGYLLDQFTTALWNKRTDKYGGDIKGRLTFPLEILAEIKKRAGADFPVQYRMGLKHYVKDLNSGALPGEEFDEAGQDIEEGLQMARLLEKGGFDSLHVDAGCYDSWYWAHPPVYQAHGCMADMAARVKKAVKIPVMAVGRMETPELAAEIIEKGEADLIALGRGLLADPEWPIKVESGTAEQVRPCIGCHDGCMGRLSSGKSLSCAVNPACAREKTYNLTPAAFSKNILVIGGGVAGMEAARVAAIRGHKVKLFEKEKELGGHLREAAAPEFKKDLAVLLRWYEKQLADLGVEMNLESPVTTEKVRKENPDVVLIATGSQPVLPDISGIENPKVVTATDLLAGKKTAGEAVLVVGGGLIGCETALWLAQQGKKVTIVEMLPALMTAGVPVPHMNRLMLLDLLEFHRVRIITQAKLQKIDNSRLIIIDKDLNSQPMKADTVVISTGLRPVNGLFKQIKSDFARTYELGDCREPRNIMGAIWDAYEVARGI